MGNAGDLCCRIPVRLLDAESAGGAAGTFSTISTARLRALACIFTRYLAHFLARFYWFAFPGHSLRDRRLFCHALADQPRQNAAGNQMKVERSPRRLLSTLVPHVRDVFLAG